MDSDVERRVRAALAATADLVEESADAAGELSLSQRPMSEGDPRFRSMRWRAPLLAAAAAAVVGLGTLTAVTALRSNGTQSPPVHAGSGPSTSVGASVTGPSPTQPSRDVPLTVPTHPVIGVAYRFDLLTHCGVDEARIGDMYLEAEVPLIVGAGNPPPGWSNPYQRGTMTMLSASQAVFRDPAGHNVLFRARPGATTFKRLCD